MRPTTHPTPAAGRLAGPTRRGRLLALLTEVPGLSELATSAEAVALYDLIFPKGSPVFLPPPDGRLGRAHGYELFEPGQGTPRMCVIVVDPTVEAGWRPVFAGIAAVLLANPLHGLEPLDDAAAEGEVGRG